MVTEVKHCADDLVDCLQVAAQKGKLIVSIQVSMPVAVCRFLTTSS